MPESYDIDAEIPVIMDRLRELPEAVWECECCGNEMKFRRASLNEAYVADDLMLKCTGCYTTRKHGVGITREEFEMSLENRPARRLVDAVDDDVSLDRRDLLDDGVVADRLEDLGYKEV